MQYLCFVLCNWLTVKGSAIKKVKRKCTKRDEKGNKIGIGRRGEGWRRKEKTREWITWKDRNINKCLGVALHILSKQKCIYTAIVITNL